MKWLRNVHGYPVLSLIVFSGYLSLGRAGLLRLDDSDSSIDYSPTWAVGNTCTGCTAKPVQGQTYQQTWHDNTRNTGGADSVYFTVPFTGTGISLHGILCNVADHQDVFITRWDVVFTLDGASAGTFVHEPSGDNTYDYGQTFFERQGLSNTAHTIRVDLNRNSMMLFDYLEVTTVDATSAADTGGSGNGSGSTAAGSSTAPSNNPSATTTSASGTSTSASSSASMTTVNGTVFTFAPVGAPTDSLSSNITNTVLPVSGGAVLGESNSNVSLSKAAIAGIAFAILALSLIFGFLLFFYWRRRHRKQMQMRIEEADSFVTPPNTVFPSPYTVSSSMPITMDRKSPVNSTHSINETPRMTMISSGGISHSYAGTETESRTQSDRRGVYSGIASGSGSGSTSTPDDTGTVISNESHNQSHSEDQSEAGRTRYRSMASVSELMAPPPYQR